MNSRIDVEAHMMAPKEIGAAQGWTKDSVQQQALHLLWLARGKWRIVDALMNRADTGDRACPDDLRLYLSNPVNRVILTGMFGKTSALYQLMSNRPRSLQ